MRNYFIIAYGQPNDRAVFYTGQYTFHGDIFNGNIEDAHLFEDMDEVCAYLAKHPYDAMNGCVIKMVADVTWERIQKGYQDYQNNVQSEYRSLYHKYNHLSYLTNSVSED